MDHAPEKLQKQQTPLTSQDQGSKRMAFVAQWLISDYAITTHRAASA
jgi:hypothetical protein